MLIQIWFYCVFTFSLQLLHINLPCFRASMGSPIIQTNKITPRNSEKKLSHGTTRCLNHTVDGRNPAPVDMVNIPLFTGFHTCQVVQDFWTINSSTLIQGTTIDFTSLLERLTGASTLNVAGLTEHWGGVMEAPRGPPNCWVLSFGDWCPCNGTNVRNKVYLLLVRNERETMEIMKYIKHYGLTVGNCQMLMIIIYKWCNLCIYFF